MRTIVVLFTRDLRVHDNPALATACRFAERVVPLFVVDKALSVPPNRRRFLVQSLVDLRRGLRELGGDLLIRQGDPVAETMKVCQAAGAQAIAMMDDYSAYAAKRHRRLTDACATARVELRTFPGATVVPPGEVSPSTGSSHYKVFTPYWRAWSSVLWRDIHAVPETVSLPSGVAGEDPRHVLEEAVGGSPSPMPGGEGEAWRRWEQWASSATDYARIHDDLPADATSHLSSYLHFGCISARAVVGDGRTPEAMVRQLCWRDFYHQVLWAFPELPVKAYRPGAAEHWDQDDQALEAWKTGNTGVPIVDAGMKQLLAQGWMHNRARMITASYLTKTMNLDWREGANWFAQWLTDADVANNYGNWQWVAGTGNDTKPYRRFSPQRQTARFDPDQKYIKRWLPE